MEKDDQKAPSFPEGYEQVEERLNETTELLQQIDRQIDSVLPDPGPAPALNPPGTVSYRQPGNRDRRISFLKDQGKRVKSDAWEKTEKDTRNGDRVTDRQVRDTVREQLFPNRFRQMSPEKRELERDKLRDVDASQDYMDAGRLAKAAERTAQPEQENQTTAEPDKNNGFASERLSRTLSYTRFIEQGRGMVAPDRTPNMERD